MDAIVRAVVLVGGLVAMVVLYYLNLYVAEKYWMPTTVDEDDGDATK